MSQSLFRASGSAAIPNVLPKASFAIRDECNRGPDIRDHRQFASGWKTTCGHEAGFRLSDRGYVYPGQRLVADTCRLPRLTTQWSLRFVKHMDGRTGTSGSFTADKPVRCSDEHKDSSTLHADGIGSRRSRAGSHMRFWYHRLRGRAMGSSLDHHRHLPRCLGARPSAHHGGSLPVLPARRQFGRPAHQEAEITGTQSRRTETTRGDVRQGFVYERVPHITLKSIANNAEIDVIWERWQEVLEPLREDLNARLDCEWEEWQIPREASEAWPAEARSRPIDCGGRRASRGSRRSTTPSRPRRTTSTSTTSPTRTTGRCGWRVRSRSKACPLTAYWSSTRTTNSWTASPRRRLTTARSRTSQA